jgi:sugar phosphate isomerase/epimerase
MKIGLVTDSLAHLPFEQMLDTAAELGIEGSELNTSNRSNGVPCGAAIHHAHAKGTYLNSDVLAFADSSGPLDNIADRFSWHVTLGYGQPEEWWREFYQLRMAGYDG